MSLITEDIADSDIPGIVMEVLPQATKIFQRSLQPFLWESWVIWDHV